MEEVALQAAVSTPAARTACGASERDAPPRALAVERLHQEISSMPAARQASRSSPKALAVSAMIGVRRAPARRLGGADAARGLDAVEPRHVHVHQHEVVRRAAAAASQASSAAAPSGATVARWPSWASSARASSALISLSSGDQDRQPAVGGFRRFRGAAGAPCREHGRQARRERGGAHRLDQIAGEAGLPERASSWRSPGVISTIRLGTLPASRQRARGSSAERAIDQQRVEVPFAAGPRARRRSATTQVARPSGRAAARDQRRLDRARRDISTRPCRPRSGGANGLAGAVGARQRDGEAERRPGRARLSTPMRPPMRSTMRREIASPSPVPPNCARRAAVGLLELLEDARLRVRRDADAGVAHRGTDLAGRGAGLDDHRDPACLGELHRIAGEVEQHLAQARDVADHAAADALVDRRGDLQALGLRARREQLDDLLDQRASANGRASRSSRPASILEKSRISSISDSSVSPEVFTALA